MELDKDLRKEALFLGVPDGSDLQLIICDEECFDGGATGVRGVRIDERHLGGGTVEEEFVCE